jgi:hypothetical protein
MRCRPDWKRLLIAASVLAVFLLCLSLVTARSLARGIERKVGQIEGIYRTAYEQHVLPFQHDPTLTPKQRHLLKQLEESHAALGDRGALQTRLKTITDFQMQARVFLQLLQEGNSAITDTSGYSAFTKEMGEWGVVRKDISTYNDLALRWNKRGALFPVVGIRGELSYLRFDGSEHQFGDIRFRSPASPAQ